MPFPRFMRTPAGREFIAAAHENTTPTNVVKDVLMSALIPNHSARGSHSQAAPHGRTTSVSVPAAVHGRNTSLSVPHAREPSISVAPRGGSVSDAQELV